MIVKERDLGRHLARPESTRLFLFFGPDESACLAHVRNLAAALGPDCNRVDVPPGELRNVPSRLADEAAAIAMFGGPSLVVVERAGEEAVPAVEALLEAPVAGNPVAIIAGDLKKGSALRRLAEGHGLAIAVASYPIDVDRGAAEIGALARARGLELDQGVAERITAAGGGNRGVIEQELDKLALHADAAPERPQRIDHARLDAIGAGSDGDQRRLIRAAAGGDLSALEAELARLRAEGQDGVGLLRAMQRHLALLAALRAEVDQGKAARDVVRKGVFWKEEAAMNDQLRRWSAAGIARALSRLVDAEWEVMRPGGPGEVSAEAELVALCRQAARSR